MAVKSPPRDLLPVGSRVVLRSDLIGVPAGTGGKVTIVNGLSWIRYWVAFENGQVQGLIDRSKLATAEQWERRHEVVAPAEVAAASESSGDSGAPSGDSGIEHLLERSRKARERLTAAKAAE